MSRPIAVCGIVLLIAGSLTVYDGYHQRNSIQGGLERRMEAFVKAISPASNFQGVDNQRGLQKMAIGAFLLLVGAGMAFKGLRH